MISQNVRLPVLGPGKKPTGILSIDDVLRWSKERAVAASISYAEIVGALKIILEGRRRATFMRRLNSWRRTLDRGRRIARV